MTYLSRLSFAAAWDLILARRLPVSVALSLARQGRWLARTPLAVRLRASWLLRGAFCLVAGVGAEAAVSLPTGDVRLEWTYSQPLSTNTIFVLKGSPTLTTNLATWATLTNIAGTSTQATVRIPAPGVYFFTLQSSNMWGVSPFSNIAETPPVPLSPVLSVKAAQ